MYNIRPRKNESPQGTQSLRYGIYKKEAVCFFAFVENLDILI